MSEISYLREYKSCDNGLARSADEDFYRREKTKSGIFFKLIIGMGLLAIIGTLAIPTLKEQVNDVQKIITAPIDPINATKLATILNNQNADMTNQSQTGDIEINGKIVEWELEILVVASLQDHYKILTMPTAKYPGTLLTLYPQNNQQMTYMETVQPGTRIKIKGKIEGIVQGRIIINPALLM